MNEFKMLQMVLANQIRILGILGMMHGRKRNFKEIGQLIEDSHKDINRKMEKKEDE